MTTGEVSANTEDLGRFVARGETYVSALQRVLDLVIGVRSATVAAVGDFGPPALATRAFQELIDEATIGNGFVDTIRDTLVAFASDDGPVPSVDSGTVDWALDVAGLRATLTGNDLSAAADQIVADRVTTSGTHEEISAAATSLHAVVEDLDRGDDLGVSNGELNRVADRLEDLEVGALVQVVANLNDEQLDRLFHNAHSSGFWSNDWNDRERTDFYDTLSDLPLHLKQRLGAFSPYLEALASAERAVIGDPAAVRAVGRLSEMPGFRQHLDFGERSAVLWQAANYPEATPIDDLGRLSQHSWFQDFDAEDTARAAKMIAFLSQYETGDQEIIDNTLDLFLAPGAPYRFDWDQDGTAYGSAGGDAFHFNRVYLDADPSPVSDDRNTQHMVTHTVAHEVNHLVNGDRVAESFQYFMAEYRAYYVGHLAKYGTAPTRAEVEGRVTYLLTAESGAYRRIAAALTDPVEGPLIADYVEGIVGRPVTAEDVATELSAGVSDPDVLAPLPIAVDGASNILDNTSPGEER